MKEEMNMQIQTEVNQNNSEEKISPAKYCQMAIDKMDKEDYEGAIEDFTQALKHRRKHSNSWFYRGQCFQHLGMYLAALSDYQMSLNCKPKQSNVWCQLGIVMFLLDDNQRADEYLSRAIKINSRHAEALQFRGYVRLLTGKTSIALIDLNKALRINSFDGWGRMVRGMILHAMERWQDALEDYDIAVSLEPNPQVYLNRAIAKYNLEQYEGALADAKKALELDPEWEECRAVIEEIEEIMDY